MSVCKACNRNKGGKSESRKMTRGEDVRPHTARPRPIRRQVELCVLPQRPLHFPCNLCVSYVFSHGHTCRMYRCITRIKTLGKKQQTHRCIHRLTLHAQTHRRTYTHPHPHPHPHGSYTLHETRTHYTMYNTQYIHTYIHTRTGTRTRTRTRTRTHTHTPAGCSHPGAVQG